MSIRMNTKPKRGLRSFFPTDKGPIDSYQLGHDGRIEYIVAEIRAEHLAKGVSSSEEWTKWAKERGVSSDEPGLVISKRLGGSGMDSVNLFPKSPLMNKTSWGTDEEKAYKEAAVMQKWKKMKFFASFDYPSEDSLRPSHVEYQYELPSGGILHAKVPNEILKEEVQASPAPAKENAEEDEESEYEYEYEEEEEEEKPEEVTVTLKKESTPPQVVTLPKPNAVVSAPPKPETDKNNDVSKSTNETKKRSPSPPPKPKSVISEPTPQVPVAKPTEPKISSETQFTPKETTPEKAPSVPTPIVAPSSSGTEKSQNDQQLFIVQSDLLEMLPIVGSLKLGLSTVKAVYNKNPQRVFWKGIQLGLSLFADFHFIRAFARHGKILTNPITEEKLVNFANKAEFQFVIFGTCKIGNELLSAIRRSLTTKG